MGNYFALQYRYNVVSVSCRHDTLRFLFRRSPLMGRIKLEMLSSEVERWGAKLFSLHPERYAEARRMLLQGSDGINETHRPPVGHNDGATEQSCSSSSSDFSTFHQLSQTSPPLHFHQETVHPNARTPTNQPRSPTTETLRAQEAARVNPGTTLSNHIPHTGAYKIIPTKFRGQKIATERDNPLSHVPCPMSHYLFWLNPKLSRQKSPACLCQSPEEESHRARLKEQISPFSSLWKEAKMWGCTKWSELLILISQFW